MFYLLFAAYLTFFCWLLPRIKFVKQSGISSKSIILLFLIKVYVGVIYGFLSYYFKIQSDNWEMHFQSIEEYHLLFSNPKKYLIDLFHDNYKNNYGGFMDTTDSYWNLLRSQIMSKILSLFDIFSGCNYYINTIFYNFLTFFGFISLYKVFKKVYPGKEKLLMISIFLLPSLLYFTSGIHKDGLIFLGISVTAYNFHIMLTENKFVWKRMIILILGLSIIFLLRNFVMITLLPALIAWFFAVKNKKYVPQTFLIIYCLFTIMFFSMYHMGPGADLPRYVSERQIAFIKISSNATSAININPLFPDFRSFMNNAPQAINHSLMRPYLTEKLSLSFLLSAGEIFCYELLFLLFIFFPHKQSKNEPFIWFGIFFSLSMMMIIGYTIPIIGAIVRYRSIYFPFILIPLLCGIDWKKILSKSY